MSTEQPIVFGKNEIDPSDEAAYRKKIEAARKTGSVGSLKANEPVGSIPRPAVPRLASTEQPGILSPMTKTQITALEDARKEAEKQVAKPPAEPSEEKAPELDDILDSFDFSGLSEAERILNNKKRRKDIESRCEAMSLDDLITKEEVQQSVPIVPGKFEVIFRSLTPEESLFIKQYIAEEQSKGKVSDAYSMEKFSLCQLCCAVVAINGAKFVEHRDSNGSPKKELFESKLKQIMRKSGYVVADLGLNYFWFDMRVRRLLSPEALGNG